MTHRYLARLLCLAPLLLAACGPDVPVVEQSAAAYKTTALEPFVRVANEASLPVHVYPTTGDSYVEFVTPRALLATIPLENKASTLTIQEPVICSYVRIRTTTPTTSRPTKPTRSTAVDEVRNNPECLQVATDQTPLVNIYTSGLENITNSGAGPVYVHGLTGTRLSVNSTGPGDIEFIEAVNLDSLSVNLKGSGNVEFTAAAPNTLTRASFTSQGAGTILADNLRTADSTVQLLGAGDVYTFTTGAVTGTVAGDPGAQLFLNGAPDTSRLQTVGLNKVIQRGE